MSTEPKLQMEKVVPVESLRGGTDIDTDEILALSEEAADYLGRFAWCARIEERFLGIGVPGLVGVFLFRIAPARSGVDPWVWVVAGDLPPAYITTDDAPNPACALDGYVGAMQSWIRAVRDGRSVENEIPVNAPATPPYAAALESRLTILDREVLPRYRGDLARGRATP